MRLLRVAKAIIKKAAGPAARKASRKARKSQITAAAQTVKNVTNGIKDLGAKAAQGAAVTGGGIAAYKIAKRRPKEVK